MSITDDILSRVNIVDIVWEYVDIKKSWSNYKWLCPFHNEKTPSFIVSEDKQIFKCFWCWAWWNVITFVKNIENVEFYEAIKILSKKAGIDLKKYKQSFKTNQKEFNLKNQLVQVNKTALNFFHKKLFENEHAFEYLTEKRKLSKEIIIKYKLWFSWTNTLEFLKYMKEKWFTDEELIQAWLAKKSSSWWLYGFFSNRIIFPIFSSIWEPIAFSWRIFNQEKNTWKYINTPETVLYNKSWILYNFNNAKKTKKDFIIVCEWYMDVIWANKLWYENTVASCWTALTERHISLLKRITKNIIFAFDSDNAWFQASLRWIKKALNLWVYPWIYKINWGKDFDEIANLWKTINIQKESKDGVIYFIDNFLQEYKVSSAIQKQEKIEQIFDLLKQIWNFNIFWDYLEKLWKRINQDSNVLYQQIKSKKHFKKDEKNNFKKDKNMIPALLYNNFYKQFVWDNSIETLLENITPVKNYIDEQNILKQILNNDIKNKKEELEQKQLLWEHNLSAWTQEKINNTLKNEVKQYIIKTLTEIVKNPKTKNKLEIIKVLNNIKKAKN